MAPVQCILVPFVHRVLIHDFIHFLLVLGFQFRLLILYHLLLNLQSPHFLVESFVLIGEILDLLSKILDQILGIHSGFWIRLTLMGYSRSL